MICFWAGTSTLVSSLYRQKNNISFFESLFYLPSDGVMVFDVRRVNDDFDIVHFDPLSVTQSLILDKRDKFHHFSMGLDLSHVLFDGELLAPEKSTLLPLVHIQAGKSIDEQIGSAIVIVSLYDYISQCGRLLLFFLLELNGALAEVIRINQYIVIISALVSEGFRYHVLFREIESAHRPILVTFECSGWIPIAVFHSIADVTFEQVEHFEELLAYFVHICLFILFILLSHFFKAVV